MMDKNPSCISRVENLIGFILYTFDILQDVWAIQRSLSSQKDYPIVSTQRIFERQFGYFMICIFIISVMVVGLDAIMKGSQLNLVKNAPWKYLNPDIDLVNDSQLQKACFLSVSWANISVRRERGFESRGFEVTGPHWGRVLTFGGPFNIGNF